MNIFVLDKRPKIAAAYHCDKHVVKMVLETAQLLSTTCNLDPGYPCKEKIYKTTHLNHPCAKWVRQSSCNYLWTVDLFKHLLNEYTARYARTHACQRLYPIFSEILPHLPSSGLTPPALAIGEHNLGDEYTWDEAVKAYRNYYIESKANIATYRFTSTPSFMKEALGVKK